MWTEKHSNLQEFDSNILKGGYPCPDAQGGTMEKEHGNPGATKTPMIKMKDAELTPILKRTKCGMKR